MKIKGVQLIDTHAHLNFKEFKDDVDFIVKDCVDRGVGLINVGSELKTSKRAVEQANKYGGNFYAAVGLHPIHVNTGEDKYSDNEKNIDWQVKNEDFNPGNYLELALNEKVVAMGEIGLDYYAANGDNQAKELQKSVFLSQLHISRMLGKPVIIHCRSEKNDKEETAHNDLLDILRNFDSHCGGCPMGGNCSSRVEGVIHCFSGTEKQAEEYLDLGLYLGFNGIITFSDEYDEIIKKMPLERILLETDCPYLTPVPFRGKRNVPYYVEFIARRIAEVRGITFEKVALTTTENAKRLFGL